MKWNIVYKEFRKISAQYMGAMIIMIITEL